RLHFKKTTGDVEDLLFAVRHFQAHRPRLERGNQRRVAVLDTEIAQRAVRHYHLHEAGENRLFRADDIAMDSHSHVSFASLADDQSVLAFSITSSMVPTM